MVSLDPEHGIVSFRQRKTGTEIVIGLHEDLANWLAGHSAPDDTQQFVFPILARRKTSIQNWGSFEVYDAGRFAIGVNAKTNKA